MSCSPAWPSGWTRFVADTTPIAQLHPDIEDGELRAVDGVVTITWPHSVVTRSIAFVVAERDFRLRRLKGQLRIEFHGPAGKAVAEARIGGGDEIRISLSGASWEPSLVSAQLLTGLLEWQLKFSTRLLMIVRRTQDEGSQVIDINEPDIIEPQSLQNTLLVDGAVSALPASPTRQSEAVPTATSPPALTTGPTPPQAKRRASLALDLEEYASPAFIKRARISFGSLFEDGLDIFSGTEKANKRKRRQSRFSMHGKHWKYSSRSPSPAVHVTSAHGSDFHQGSGKDFDSEAVGNGADSQLHKPKMVEEACQTQQEYFDLPLVNVSPTAEIRLLGVTEQSIPPATKPLGAIHESHHEGFQTPSRSPFERQSSDYVTFGVTRQPETAYEAIESHDHHGYDFAPGPLNSPIDVLCASAIAASSIDSVAHDEGITPRVHNQVSPRNQASPMSIHLDPRLQFLTELHALSNTFCGTPPPESMSWVSEPVRAERPSLTSAPYDSPLRRRSSDTNAVPSRRGDYGRNTYVTLGDSSRELYSSKVANRNDAGHVNWNEIGVSGENDHVEIDNHAGDDEDVDEAREDDFISKSGEAEQRRLSNYSIDAEENGHRIQTWEAIRDGKASESASGNSGSCESGSVVESRSYHDSERYTPQAERFDSEEPEYTCEGQGDSGQDASSYDDRNFSSSPGTVILEEPVVISLLSDSEDEGASPRNPTTANSPHAEFEGMRSAQGHDGHALVPPFESQDSQHVSEQRESLGPYAKEEDEALQLENHRPEDNVPTYEDVSAPFHPESIELAKYSPRARSSAAHSLQDSLDVEDEGLSHNNEQLKYAVDSTDRLIVPTTSEPASSDLMDVDQEGEGEMGSSSLAAQVTKSVADHESPVPHEAQCRSLTPYHSQQQTPEDVVLVKTESEQTDVVGECKERTPTPSNAQAAKKTRWSPVTESDSFEEDRDDLAAEEQVLAEYESCRSSTRSMAMAVNYGRNKSRGKRSLPAAPEIGKGQQSQGSHMASEVPLSVDPHGCRTLDKLRYSEETDDECARDPSLALAMKTCVSGTNADGDTYSECAEDPSFLLATAISVPKANTDGEIISEHTQDPSLALARTAHMGKALDGDEGLKAAIASYLSAIDTGIKNGGTSSENDKNPSPASARVTSTSKSSGTDTEKPLIKKQEPETSAISYSLRSRTHRRNKSDDCKNTLDAALALDKAGPTCQSPSLETDKALDEDQEPEAHVAPYPLRSRTHRRAKRDDASSQSHKNPSLAVARLGAGSTCKSPGLELGQARNEDQMTDAPSTPYSLRRLRHGRARSGGTEHSEQDDGSSHGLTGTTSGAVAEGEESGTAKQSLYVVLSQSHESHTNFSTGKTSGAYAKGGGRQTTPCTKKAEATASWIGASSSTSRGRQVSPGVWQEMQTRAQEMTRKTTPDTIVESGMLTSPSIAGSVTEDNDVMTLKRAILRTLREGLADFVPLRNLPSSLNKVTDILGVSTSDPCRPYRPKHGPRDYMLELIMTDPSIGPTNVAVAHLFRPHQFSLPAVKAGDVVLLRRMHVVSMQGRGFGVRAGDLSSWVVFEKDSEEMLPQVKGPPVEVTEDEVKYAQGLKRWWAMQDEKAFAKIQKAKTAKASQAK